MYWQAEWNLTRHTYQISKRNSRDARDGIWRHAYTPWPTHTEYKHPSALSPYGFMSRKFLFSGFPLQIRPPRVLATGEGLRCSTISPLGVCGCVLLSCSQVLLGPLCLCWEPTQPQVQTTAHSLSCHRNALSASQDLLLQRGLLQQAAGPLVT